MSGGRRAPPEACYFGRFCHSGPRQRNACVNPFTLAVLIRKSPLLMAYLHYIYTGGFLTQTVSVNRPLILAVRLCELPVHLFSSGGLLKEPSPDLSLDGWDINISSMEKRKKEKKTV